MADEVTTTTKKSAPVKEVEVKEQEVLIPVAEDAAVEGVDHNAAINKALDAARDAMIASGMSEGDADAFLNSARPRGVSTVTGNFADLQRMTGLPTVQSADPDNSRLKFAHKAPEETPAETKGF